MFSWFVKKWSIIKYNRDKINVLKRQAMTKREQILYGMKTLTNSVTKYAIDFFYRMLRLFPLPLFMKIEWNDLED